MTTTDNPNDDQPDNADERSGTDREPTGDVTPPEPDPADNLSATNDRRTRLFGLVAASAIVVVLAIVVWVAVDGIGTDNTGQSPTSESAARDPERATGDQGDGPAAEKDEQSKPDGGSPRGEQPEEPDDANQDGQPDELTEHLLSLQRREPDDPMAKGAVDAPVVLIMYEDFRCPFCAKFANDVEPALERYVEAGQLRLEWRDYPIFGKQSLEVAKAARAAARQDRFWEFYEVAFSVGNGDGKPKFPDERIRRVAERAGVPDMAQFDRDRNDPEVMDEISADATEGQQIGVSSTPAFLINTEPVLGTQPVRVFVSIIEEELKNS